MTADSSLNRRYKNRPEIWHPIVQEVPVNCCMQRAMIREVQMLYKRPVLSQKAFD